MRSLNNMSSLDKMLEILEIFRAEKVGIEIDDVMALTRSSRATAYRYLRSLVSAGLLSPSTGGTHVLGPRICELDRLMRRSDPLLTSSRVPARELSSLLNANVVVCSYYGDKVLCADIIWPDQTAQQFFERGRPLPMFKGAMGKIILAHLSPYQLRKLLTWNASAIRDGGLATSWSEFRKTMRSFRKAGIVITRDEVALGVTCAAAPLFDPEHRVVGSIAVVVPNLRFDQTVREEFIRPLVVQSKKINMAITTAAEKHAAVPRTARLRATRIVSTGNVW